MKAKQAFKDVGEVLIENRLDEATISGVIGYIKNKNVMKVSFPLLIKGISDKPGAMVKAGLYSDTDKMNTPQEEVDATEAYYQIIKALGIETKMTLDFQHGLIEFLNNLAKYNKIKNRPVQLPGEGKENRA